MKLDFDAHAWPLPLPQRRADEMTSTARTGATYDIDGGQQLIPTSSR